MDNPDKKYNVIVSERAAEMLVEHVMFLAQASVEAAETLRAQVIEAVRSLEVMPQRCSWLSAEMIPPNKYRKLVVNKRYLITYQVRDDTVYVDYILDCRQDYQWLI